MSKPFLKKNSEDSLTISLPLLPINEQTQIVDQLKSYSKTTLEILFFQSRDLKSYSPSYNLVKEIFHSFHQNLTKLNLDFYRWKSGTVCFFFKNLRYFSNLNDIQVTCENLEDFSLENLLKFSFSRRNSKLLKTLKIEFPTEHAGEDRIEDKFCHVICMFIEMKVSRGFRFKVTNAKDGKKLWEWMLRKLHSSGTLPNGSHMDITNGWVLGSKYMTEMYKQIVIHNKHTLHSGYSFK